MPNDPIAGLTGVDALRAAKLKVAQAEAEAEAERERRRQVIVVRSQQYDQGAKALSDLRSRLFSVLEEVPRSDVKGDEFRCGRAIIRISKSQKGPDAPLTGIDVLGWSQIELTCTKKSGASYKWSASLIYARESGAQKPRWMEIGFFDHPLAQNARNSEPFSLDPMGMALALSPGMSQYAVAYGPVPIDGEMFAAFIERWTTMFAKAMVGELSRPTRFPISI